MDFLLGEEQRLLRHFATSELRSAKDKNVLFREVTLPTRLVSHTYSFLSVFSFWYLFSFFFGVIKESYLHTSFMREEITSILSSLLQSKLLLVLKVIWKWKLGREQISHKNFEESLEVNSSRASVGVDVNANMEKILTISQSIIDRFDFLVLY